MSQMPVLIILAGGSSSRMWPLREKLFLKFGEEPLVITQLKRYERLGFREAIIVGNPENVDSLKAISSDLDSLSLEVVVQEEAIGMGDALLKTASFFEDRPDTAIFVTQVHDVVEDSLYEDVANAHQQYPDTTFIVGVEMERYFPGGYLVVEDDIIKGIVEKPGAGNEPSNLVTIVAHLHSHVGRLFDAVRAEYAKDIPSDDHYERAMDALMNQHEYRVVRYSGVWTFLKFPWHPLEVMDFFLSQIEGQQVHETAFVAPTASLVGDVYIGEGVKVFPGAAVVGPAYIGKGTIVGNNALVRSSMVLDNCNVGFTTEVARSYVAEGCQMHACRVLDSVFAPNVNFSAGCTTANLRIDKGNVSSLVKGNPTDSGRDKLGAMVGEGAFLSVDVMTMPGVKVGEQAEVGPGMHVRHDVKDKQRTYVKQEIVVVED